MDEIICSKSDIWEPHSWDLNPSSLALELLLLTCVLASSSLTSKVPASCWTWKVLLAFGRHWVGVSPWKQPVALQTHLFPTEGMSFLGPKSIP